MKVIRSVSLILLFTIFGIHKGLAQTTEIQQDDTYYIVVFGNFGGESQFFNQYPYNRDFPEGIQNNIICSQSFWTNPMIDDFWSFIRSTIIIPNVSCGDDIDYNSVYVLFHPTLRNGNGVEVFVIPITYSDDRNIPQWSMTNVVLMVQILLLDTDGTALEIRRLIDETIQDMWETGYSRTSLEGDSAVAPPTPLALSVSPAIGTGQTPIVTVNGVSPGDTVTLYHNNSCTGIDQGSQIVLFPNTSVDIEAKPLPTTNTRRTYTYYAQVSDSMRNLSPCSTQSATYTLTRDN